MLQCTHCQVKAVEELNVQHHRGVQLENEERDSRWFWTGYPPQPRGGALADERNS